MIPDLEAKDPAEDELEQLEAFNRSASQEERTLEERIKRSRAQLLELKKEFPADGEDEEDNALVGRTSVGLRKMNG